MQQLPSLKTLADSIADGMIEVAEKGEKPEYIVWNASLEVAFKEIDKLVEFLF